MSDPYDAILDEYVEEVIREIGSESASISELRPPLAALAEKAFNLGSNLS